MQGILNALKTIDRIVLAVLKALTITLFLLLSLLVGANVLVRFVPVVSLHWFDEIVEMLYAGLVFYGAAALWITREHFSLGDWIGSTILKGSRARHWYRAALEVMVLIFAAIFFYYSLRLTILAHTEGATRMILEQFSLKGKVAVVTGGTIGLGEAMAFGLAEAGADIAAVYHTDLPRETERFAALGRRWLGVQADLGSIAPVNEIVRQVVEAYGRIDILVNNAGIIRRNRSIDFTEKDWDEVMDINLKTLFFLSQAVARQFLKQGQGGKIINIASMLSFQGGILVPSYTASKSGVMGLTRLLACEWAPHGINVNAIAPGYMATRNTQAIQDDPVRSRQILERIPAGR